MKSVKAGGRAQPELSVTEATVHARASQSVSVPETTEPAPGRSSRAAGAKVGGAVKTTAQPKPESKGRTTRRGSAPKPAAPPGDGVERVSPADAAHAQPPTEAAVPAAAASVDAGPPQPEPAARTQESSREPAQKRGRVPSKRIAALQGSPGLDDPPTGLKRPAADALTASVDAAEDGAPALPRGGKSKAKRSKRQQLDDEVVKAKYLADLKQYVEERGLELGDGWTVSLVARNNGTQAGGTDKYYHHPELLAGRASCRSREDVVRLLLGTKGSGRLSGSGSAAAAPSRQSSRNGGAAKSAAAAKATPAAVKAATSGSKQDAAVIQGGSAGGGGPVDQERQGQQLQPGPQQPASPRPLRKVMSSPRRVASSRAAADFGAGRHQQPAAAADPQAADPAGRPGRRRAAAAAAAAVQQAAAAEGAAEDEDDGAPVARSRGGRVLKRSAAAQDDIYQPSSDDIAGANEGLEEDDEPTDDEWEARGHWRKPSAGGGVGGAGSAGGSLHAAPAARSEPRLRSGRVVRKLVDLKEASDEDSEEWLEGSDTDSDGHLGNGFRRLQSSAYDSGMLGNELQMMLRRMVPSHPQADARNLARTAQQTQQQPQQAAQRQQQQQEAQQQPLNPQQQPVIYQAASAGASAAPAPRGLLDDGDVGTAGGEADSHEGRFPADDQEYLPDGVAPVLLSAAPQHAPAQPSAAPSGMPAMQLTMDAARLYSAAEPGEGLAVLDLPASKAAGMAPVSAGADAQDDLATSEHAAVGSEGKHGAAQQDGVCAEAGQQPKPSPSGRGDLPELAEEIAATAMQGVRNSHGVQLFRLVRVVSGEEDDLLKPGLMSSDSAALGTSAATGEGQLQRELQPLTMNGAAVRLLNGSSVEAVRATKRQRLSVAGSQGSTATGSAAGTPLNGADAGVKSEFLASLTEKMLTVREERRASAAAGGSPQTDLAALLGPKPVATQNGRRCEARPRVVGDPRVSVYEAPASPYGLIEEQLYDNPWKLLVACILLNKTSIAQVRKVIWALFALCPTPEAMVAADLSAIGDIVAPLGLNRKRGAMLQRFSKDYLTKDWQTPEQLHGIGKYGADAYFMFSRGEWRATQPTDKDLLKYKQWLESTGGEGSGLTRDPVPASGPE